MAASPNDALGSTVGLVLGAIVAVALMAGAVIGVVALDHGLSAAGQVRPWRSTGVTETLSDYSIAGDSTAPAGNVTFAVLNQSSSVSHEMIVLRTDTPFDKIPVADSGDPPVPVRTGADKVDEGANIGETGDPNLAPDEVRTFTIRNMAPGQYVLLCNLAGHYAMGMRLPFTVTP